MLTPQILCVQSILAGLAFNTAIWDGNFDTAQTTSALNEMGTRILRGPGGSLSDEYHWSDRQVPSPNTFNGPRPFLSSSISLLTSAPRLSSPVNYGTSMGNTRGGQAKEAAAWSHTPTRRKPLTAQPMTSPWEPMKKVTIGRTVGYWARLRTLTAASNPDNQYDFLAIGRASPIAIKYWEVGNENYGTGKGTLTRTLPTAVMKAGPTPCGRPIIFSFMRNSRPQFKIGNRRCPRVRDGYQNGYTAHPTVNAHRPNSLRHRAGQFENLSKSLPDPVIMSAMT